MVTGRMATRLHWLMIILLFPSYILGILAADACDFLLVKVPNPQNVREDLEWGIGFSDMRMPPEVASFYGQDGGCESLDTNTGSLDILSNSTAQSFAIFHCLLSTAGVIIILAMTFKKSVTFSPRDLLWLILRIIMYISMLCAIFSFFLRETETCDQYACSLGWPGIAQAINVGLLLNINFVLFFTDPGDEQFIRFCSLSAEEARRRNRVSENQMTGGGMNPDEYPNRVSVR